MEGLLWVVVYKIFYFLQKVKEIFCQIQKLLITVLMTREEEWSCYSGVCSRNDHLFPPNTFFRISVVLATGFERIFASSFATWSNKASTALPTT